MRAIILILTVILLVLVGCESNMKTHELFYGAVPPPVISITVGDIEAVKPIGKSIVNSPSMIVPNRLAIIKMVAVLKGQGVGARIGLAYEAGRGNEPAAKQRYVFFWDQAGTCIQYFTVIGNCYIKDGHEIPLDDLKKQ